MSARAKSASASVCTAGASTYTAAAVVKSVALEGFCSAIASGSATVVKVAPGLGAASAGAAVSGAAVKAAPQAGTCPAGAAPAGAAGRRVALAGAAAVAGSATGTARKLAPGAGQVAAGAASTAAAVKVTAQTGRAAAGACSTAAARKVAAALGRGGAVGSGAAVAAKRVALAGVGCGGAGAAARTSYLFGGAVSAGPSSTALQRKTANVTGRCTAAANGRATSGRLIALAGRCFGGAGVRAIARKVTGHTGRCVGGATTYGYIIIVGPTTGTRVSPPLAIPDGPITGSRIWWEASVPGGATLAVETSVDGGATWQVATNAAPVPRLLQGDTRTARTVLTRATLTRMSPDDPTPRLQRLEVEVAVDSSREELCPLGVFTLNDVEIDDSPRGLSIELSGADLARRVSRNRWDDTYVVVEGTNYATAIQDMIRDRMPDAVFNFASTSRTTPRLFFGEQASNDPWQDAQDLATAIGYELFFDARGICTLRPEPDPEIGDSVWEFDDLANPTMVELRRRVTDENTYNKVVVTGEGSGNTVPVRAVAIDDDPASPTYYLGPYGTVTLRVTSPLVTTTEQAQDAADALLRRVKGATEAVELSAVPMPALEPGDVVTVTRGRSKVQGRFLIDQLRIPLGPADPMRAVGRRQRQ